MRNFDPSPLRALLHHALHRYLTVTSQGFLLQGEPRPVATVQARILGFGGARTLYRNRKPYCRSLDGLVSINLADRRCTSCPDVNACTPQVRVDLIIDKHAYRLLLAFTSARNFLEHVGRLRREGIDPLSADHQIVVTPRGSWGELRFRVLE